MKGTNGVGLAAAVFAVLAAWVAAPGSAQAGTQTVQTIATGVTLTRIVEPAGPQRVYVLTIDPSAPSTVDMATPSGEMGDYATPSSIGSARGAIAAINGDFSVNPGRPLHGLLTDGSLLISGMQGGAAFAMSKDETHAYIDDRSAEITGQRLPAGRVFTLRDTNGSLPSGGGIAEYTRYGSWAATPPRNACSVQLKWRGKLHWGVGDVGDVRDWVVGKSACGTNAMGVAPGTVVLSSHRSGSGARTLRTMKPGDAVRLTTTLGWPDVLDSVGGMPVLVHNGKATTFSSCNDYFCSRNPRTAIGVTATGQVLWVVVDGRSSGSAGMTLPEFAHYLVQLGAVSAINLDGGGGSAMWVAGLGVVNHPSDMWGERPVTNAVVLLPGDDPGEPSPLTYSGSASVGHAPAFGHGRVGAMASTPMARHAMSMATNDPGSTGGLLQAMADGAI
jgi:hypothetical protein